MKKLLFSAFVGAMIISCSRDNDSTNPTTPQTPATNEIGILPVKFTSSNGKIATMTYNGNKLAKIIDDGTIWNVTYNGNLIKSIKSDGNLYEFNYDSNGNLISEKLIIYYDDNITKNEEIEFTYNLNGSNITGQKINKLYLTNGTLNETKTSTINYTLDAQKRPLTTKTEYKRYSPANILTFETKMFSTYQYANYNNIVKNIVGFDKLVYSDFILDDELPFDIISYLKEEVTHTNYSSGVPTPAPGGFVNELKYEHTVNSNNYPIKKENLKKNSTTGQFQKNGSYQTIEYNK
jgi:lipoprotein